MSSNIGKICLSLLPESETQVYNWVEQHPEITLFELRLDFLPEIDFKQLKQRTGKQFIVTVRPQDEGGKFSGTVEQRIAVFKQAIQADIDYVDIELRHKEEILPRLPEFTNTQLILSVHSTTNNPEVLEPLLHQLLSEKADVYKFIFTAKELNDVLLARRFIDKAREAGKRFVIHAMGEVGANSRLFGALQGNEWTYAAVQHAHETADGQFTIQNLRHHFYIHEKSPQTKILGLVGYPTRQSKGWRLHNFLIHQKFNGGNTNFLYVNFPTQDVESFLEHWGAVVHGFSVTIPHKEAILPFLDKRSIGVKISGVCNTVVKCPEGWCGYNTDLYALETIIKQHKANLEHGAVVIGTGGTARSAIAALRRLEVYPIMITGRNQEKGAQLAKLFGVDYMNYNEIIGVNASLIIQTTPVGMIPNINDVPPGIELLKRGRIVLDVIYNPAETRFLKHAKAKGCITISGVDMFVLQAAKQFELFTGTSVSVSEVREAFNRISVV